MGLGFSDLNSFLIILEKFLQRHWKMSANLNSFSFKTFKNYFYNIIDARQSYIDY